MQTEPVLISPTEPTRDRRVPLLRPLDREWLKRWSHKLDPRRQPSVSGAAAVAWLLERVPPAARWEGTPSVWWLTRPSDTAG